MQEKPSFQNDGLEYFPEQAIFDRHFEMGGAIKMLSSDKNYLIFVTPEEGTSPVIFRVSHEMYEEENIGVILDNTDGCNEMVELLGDLERIDSYHQFKSQELILAEDIKMELREDEEAWHLFVTFNGKKAPIKLFPADIGLKNMSANDAENLLKRRYWPDILIMMNRVRAGDAMKGLDS